MKNYLEKPFVLPSIVFGVFMLAGLAIIGWGISARGQDNVISVTGSASEAAVADEATWAIDLNQTAFQGNLASASTQLSEDANAVTQYLSSQDLASSSVETSAISISQNYSSNGAPDGYTVSDTVNLSTSDVQKVDTLSHKIAAIDAVVSPQTIVSPEQPQYYVSTLPQMRVSLLGAAIKDARARAVAIAQSGGSSVGPLETADSGVVQVLVPNSANAEDDGQYDTSTIQKEVTVTVRASFYVR